MNEANLTRHIREHTKHTEYKCQVCKQSYSSRESLRCHVKTEHGTNSMNREDFIVDFKCNVCHKSYSRKDNLKSHMKTQHMTTDKSYDEFDNNETGSQKTKFRNWDHIFAIIC